MVTILRPPEDLPEEDEPGAARGDVAFRATVLSIQDSLMYLRAPAEAPVSSALRIETSDALWLGETEKSESENGGWRIRVRLRHVLRDFDTLARLAERFGAAPPRRISVQA